MEVLTGFSNEIWNWSALVDKILVEDVTRLNKRYKAEHDLIEKLSYFRERALDAYSRLDARDRDRAHFNQEISL